MPDIKVLTQDQIREIKAEMIDADKAIPVRFLKNGCAVNIESGAVCSRGSNVFYHPVYWNFTKETAKKIGRWLDLKPVFS